MAQNGRPGGDIKVIKTKQQLGTPINLQRPIFLILLFWGKTDTPIVITVSEVQSENNNSKTFMLD